MAQLQRAQPQAKCQKYKRKRVEGQDWPQHSWVGQRGVGGVGWGVGRVGWVMHDALLSQMGGVVLGA